MKSIGIIGIGFVGNAIKNFFQSKVKTICYDKYKNFDKIENILYSEIVFLCLPTLYNEEKGEYDKSAIIEVCEYLNNMEYKGIIILKSTVEPETTNNLSEHYRKLKICHNPEFLTARTAEEDFANQKHIIIGKGINMNDNDVNFIENFFKKYYPEALISNMFSTESECVKLFCNCFGASKIILFNEYFMLCNKLNLNFDKIRDCMLRNNWINPMHTNVPGPDGDLGYGGLCFPKDTKALNSYMEKKKTEHQVLNSVIEECYRLRK